ncbi:hypothetical protein JX265_002138 [Neoarthrinium moseri]|uniref:NmrA-like domain-containing protein n=1 Tax=Neoarthrinium moseri TaxID=1658444 RepID=A0A9P9WTP8_9PEZI|nr:hypothetical protein JX266_004100 [Neoarthrinium moseri]KAI1879184.1 hypothetical protein JX265_002138 [Neoarthrinium moseri]
MSTILQNVAVVGASGNLGAPIVKELLAQGFNVTVITREGSSSVFPSSVTVKKLDVRSVPALTTAFRGQDAVVNAAAKSAVEDQLPLIDAALAAGVQRFLPAEFGINQKTPSTHAFAVIVKDKAKVVDYLVRKANENAKFSWTGLSVGLFLDWALVNGLAGFHKATRTAEIFDSGNETFHASSLGFIGRAVAAVLCRPSATANKYLVVSGVAPTQNEILRVIETATGQKWAVKHVDSKEKEKQGIAALEKSDYNGAFLPLLHHYLFSDGGGNGISLENSDNAVLGLEADDLPELIKSSLMN